MVHAHIMLWSFPVFKFFGGGSSVFFFKGLLWYVVESGVYGCGIFR